MARTGVPLALVIVDVDDLKAVNDALGHQAGDERLQALARAMRATGRGADRLPRGRRRVRGHAARRARWGALEFAQRLREATQDGDHGGDSFTTTAGISEALGLRSKDELIREADLALIGAKRIHQDVVIYGPDLAPGAEATPMGTTTTRAPWPARRRARSTPRTPTRAVTARPSRSCAG